MRTETDTRNVPRPQIMRTDTNLPRAEITRTDTNLPRAEITRTDTNLPCAEITRTDTNTDPELRLWERIPTYPTGTGPKQARDMNLTAPLPPTLASL